MGGSKSLRRVAEVSSSEQTCKVLSGTFATALQVLLGFISMSTLFYKRWIVEVENPRTYEVWLMDVSKQGVQSIFMHFTNIFLAVVFASIQEMAPHTGGDSSASHDECAFYFLQFLADSAIGVQLIWLALRGVRSLAQRMGWTSIIQQGFYGNPPSFSVYMKQLSVFLGATALSKFAIGLAMLYSREELDVLGTWIFDRLHLNPATELTFVMVVCPFFLNAAQYWLLDNILMGRTIPRADESDGQLKGLLDDASLIITPSRLAPLEIVHGKDGVRALFRVRANS
jgi:hypothetical protein